MPTQNLKVEEDKFVNEIMKEAATQEQIGNKESDEDDETEDMFKLMN